MKPVLLNLVSCPATELLFFFPSLKFYGKTRHITIHTVPTPQRMACRVAATLFVKITHEFSPRGHFLSLIFYQQHFSPTYSHYNKTIHHYHNKSRQLDTLISNDSSEKAFVLIDFKFIILSDYKNPELYCGIIGVVTALLLYFKRSQSRSIYAILTSNMS